MSGLIRTPKSASDWSYNELEAYSITIKEQNIASFFGRDELPEPNCPEGFLRNLVITENTDRATDELLRCMGEVGGQFVRSLFLETGFSNKQTYPCMRRPLPFLIGGEQKSAQTDVCLVYDDTVLLLVQEDKAKGKLPGYGEAQLIAEAIAARQHNVIGGMVRQSDTEIVPAILMIGTYPVFYKIPVSAKLNQSIASLHYPTIETVITKCSPKVPRHSSRYEEGMRPLDNRTIILKYLEAFRRHVFIPCSEDTLGTQLIL